MHDPLLAGISAILFDMDGVIVDSMPHHARAWRTVLGKHGLTLQDEDIFRREGMTGSSSVIDIFREKGINPPDSDELANLQNSKDKIFEEAQISLYPGIRDIITRLSSSGCKLGLVTGSFRRSVYHSIPPDILALFDVTVTADDVTRGKPDPEPYIRAMQKCGCLPVNTLVVENAPMGIAAAKSAGARCIAIKTTLGEDFLSKSDAIVNDHVELMDFFIRRIPQLAGLK